MGAGDGHDGPSRVGGARQDLPMPGLPSGDPCRDAAPRRGRARGRRGAPPLAHGVLAPRAPPARPRRLVPEAETATSREVSPTCLFTFPIGTIPVRPECRMHG